MRIGRFTPGWLLAARTAHAAVLKPYTPELSTAGRVKAALAIAGLTLFCIVYGYFYAITTPFLLTQMLAPFLVLGALSIWALPDGQAVPAKTLEWLLYAFFLMLLLWPEYLAITLPGLPWITSVRLVGFPLAFVLLVAVSTSPEFRQKTLQSLNAVPGLWKLVAGFTFLQAFSILLTDRQSWALNGLVADQLRWTTIFFVSAFVFRKPGTVHRWAITLWLCAIVVCLIGLWEQRLGQVPWAGHLPSFFSIQDEYVQRVLHGARRLGTGAYRIQSVHSTSLGLAEALALTTPFILHFMMGPFHPRMRLAAAASLPLIFYVTLVTGARLGMVGFFLSGLIYLAAWSYVRFRRDRSNLFASIVVYGYPAIFCGFLALTFTVGRLKRMVWGGGETEASNQGRMDQLADGIPLILARPWGYGYNRGASVLDYTNGNDVLTIDNYFLAVALDLGILGLLCYCAMLLLPIWYAVKYGVINPSTRQREHTYLMPIATSLMVFFVIKSIFSQPHNHTLHFMMMGIIGALVYRITKGVPGDETTPAIQGANTR